MTVVNVVDELKKHDTKKYPYRHLSSITHIAIHHSLTEPNSDSRKDVEAFARYHVEENDWPGIAYAYVIGYEGTVFKTNIAVHVTYHVGNHNRKALGICLVGDFRDSEVPKEQYNAAIELVQICMDSYEVPIENVLGHSEFEGYKWKECPAFDMDKFRKDLLSKG